MPPATRRSDAILGRAVGSEVCITIPSSGHVRTPGSLVAAMIAQFAAGGAVIPFVTLLLEDRGLSLERISLVFLAASTTLLVFPFLWGLVADRFLALDRLFVVANLLAATALGFMATQHRFWGLLMGFAMLTACLNPTFTLINALAFHHLPNPREQFGALRSWGSFGWIVPFLPIALWTAWRPQAGLDFTLYLGAGICLTMAAVAFTLPRTPPGACRADEGQDSPGHYLPALRRLFRDPDYVVLLVSMFLIAGSYALMLFYSPPFLEKLGLPRPWIGPVQAIGVILEIVLLRWQPAFLRRFDFTAIILTGCAALCVRHLLFTVSSNLWVLSLSYLLGGMLIVFFHMVVSVLVNAMASREVRATAQTMLALAGQGLGPMFANFVAGRIALASGGNLRPVFLFAAAMAGMAGLLIASRGRRLNRAGHPRPKPQA
jgi:MFS family permease